MAIDIRSVNTTPNTQVGATEVRDGNKAQQNAAVSAANAQAQANTKAATGSDSVQITDRARELQSLASRLSKEPSVDTEKVSRLRQEIADGRYSVNNQRLASKILGLERDFKGR